MIPPSLITTPPAPSSSKRQRSRESRKITIPTGPTPSNTEQDPPGSPSLRIPPFLNQNKQDISKLFLELEWRQRFRLQHALNDPKSSPFRLDRSPLVFSRNRYSNIQPWDQSRIRLKYPIGGSDYVNASPISLQSKPMRSTTPDSSTDHIRTGQSAVADVDLPRSKYIATQGPKDGHFSHFWNMVVQETLGEQGVVVMLTPCWEGNREKCGQYFPLNLDMPIIELESSEAQENGATMHDDGDPFQDPAPFSIDADCDPAEHSSSDLTSRGPTFDNKADRKGIVTLLEMRFDQKSRSEVRKLMVRIGGESKIIWHYLFSGWPDYTKPEGDDRRALLELIKQSARQAGDPSLSPRVIHCSAGVGRTGTFIALDYLLSELAHGHLEAGPGRKLPTFSQPSSSFLGQQQQYPHPQPLSPLRVSEEDSDATSLSTKGEIASLATTTGKESTPEVKEDDPVFDTVNSLREQRMMMVMNEIQFQFLYEVLRESYVETYSRPRVGSPAREVEVGQTQRAGDVDAGATTPVAVDPAPDLTGEPSPKMARTENMASVGPL